MRTKSRATAIHNMYGHVLFFNADEVAGFCLFVISLSLNSLIFFQSKKSRHHLQLFGPSQVYSGRCHPPQFQEKRSGNSPGRKFVPASSFVVSRLVATAADVGSHCADREAFVTAKGIPEQPYILAVGSSWATVSHSQTL